MFESSHVVLAARETGQDRMQILREGERLILALADGAGGRSGGVEAAELAMKLVSHHAYSLDSPSACEKLIAEIDSAILTDKIAGETTMVIVVASPRGIFGASVGDSGAWILNGANVDDLTQNQQRRPFVGTGESFAAGFSRHKLEGTVLIATDGLLKYTSREMIASVIEKSNLNETPAALVKLVRYASGNLPDDIAIGLCRSI